MKANELEKIYVALDEIDEGGRTFVLDHRIDYPICTEYTRTDAFIEKACSWLRTHSEGDYFELIPDANYCGAGNLNKKRMIEDFRAYMKGE